MNPPLTYMIKAAVYLAGFYIIYFTFLSKDTKYTRNRLFILLSIAAAFAMPLITLNFKEQSSLYYLGRNISEVFVKAKSTGGQAVLTPEGSSQLLSIPFRIYLAGVICFGIKLLVDLFSLILLILRNKGNGSNVIFFKGFNTAGFSAMGNIFISSTVGKNEVDEIIKHEQKHLDNKHFLDILFIEIALIVQWFNPFAWLLNRSLRALHEYQADRCYLSSGTPVVNYQKLLLNHVLRSGRINIYNCFSNPSLIRKRMIMMSKEPSTGISDLKILIVAPVIFMILAAISACEKKPDIAGAQSGSSESRVPAVRTVEIPEPEALVKRKIYYEPPSEVFVVVEEMPTFPGGDQALMKFINNNIVFPKQAIEKSIQGRVILRFVVTDKGKIDRISVLKGVDPVLDNEAKRVISSLPDWKPGRQGGKPVNVWYSVPVTFQLR